MNNLIQIINSLIGIFLFIGLIDVLLILLSILGLDIQTRGTEWYKMDNFELYERLKYAFSFIVFGMLYFKYIEPKLPKLKGIKKFNFSICPKCKELFNYNELKDGKCKYCEDVDTIDTNKYYKEHPEELES